MSNTITILAIAVLGFLVSILPLVAKTWLIFSQARQATLKPLLL